MATRSRMPSLILNLSQPTPFCVTYRSMHTLHRLPHSRFMSSSTGPSSSQPPWLESILQDRSPAPRIYSWTPNNGPSRPHTRDALDPRRIYVLGVGNMGRLYATSLAKLSNPPPITLVLHRKELLSDWEAGRGVEMTRLDVTERDNKVSFDVEYWTDEQTVPRYIRSQAKLMRQSWGSLPPMLVFVHIPFHIADLT